MDVLPIRLKNEANIFEEYICPISYCVEAENDFFSAVWIKQLLVAKTQRFNFSALWNATWKSEHDIFNWMLNELPRWCTFDTHTWFKTIETIFFATKLLSYCTETLLDVTCYCWNWIHIHLEEFIKFQLKMSKTNINLCKTQ